MRKIKNCCIVDDDEFFAFQTKKLMKEKDFCENVLVFSDGQEAIDGLIGLLIEDITLPEIILLDLNMPRKNGWEFLEDFAKIPFSKRKHTIIYIVSSFVSQKNLEKIKLYKNVGDYIVKPFTVDSLQQITAAHTPAN